jgi:hypothetical protein
MQNRCSTCPRPVPDTAYGCSACATDLAQRLDQLAGFLPEVETTIARQDRIGSGGPRAAGAEIPLPYRPEAAEKTAAIRGELTTWARDVMAESGRELRGGSSPALARYLASVVDWARYRPSWPEFRAALRPLFGSVLHLVDRPAEKVYLGPCNTEDPETHTMCVSDVYGKPGAAVGVCRACGAEHDVAESRRWLLGMLEDRLARPVEIAGVLRGFGDAKVGYSTIAAYVASGQLVAHGTDGHGRELFRIGDVLELRLRLKVRKVA